MIFMLPDLALNILSGLLILFVLAAMAAVFSLASLLRDEGGCFGDVDDQD